MARRGYPGAGGELCSQSGVSFGERHGTPINTASRRYERSLPRRGKQAYATENNASQALRLTYE